MIGMTSFAENVASAVRALKENWLRSALTMLGIIIGVGSVVLLVAIGQGVKQDVTRQIESLGTNVVIIVPGKLDTNGQPNPMALLGISTLTEKDAIDIARIPGVTLAVPLMFVYGYLEHNKETYSAFVLASGSTIARIRPRPFTEGRFFLPQEEDQAVCVLANGPKTQVFGKAPALGQTVSIRSIPFKVVGVLAPEQDDTFVPFASFSNVVYVPYTSARRLYKNGQINRILLDTDYKKDPAKALAAVKETLMRNHGREDFGILTSKQLLSAIYKVFNIVTALLAGISAISLVVAGIGIMNIMLVTVTERTREIGIRKTVGARRRDIFQQFLTEAIILSFVGGVVGTLGAVAICKIVAAETALKPLITPWVVLEAFGVCFLVGLIFGVTPAMRAARQNPIDALRWE